MTILGKLLLPFDQEDPARFSSYKRWQRHFLKKRLRLALWFGIFYFFSLYGMFFLQARWFPNAYTSENLHRDLLTEVPSLILLTACLVVLETRLGSRHLGLLFLFFSGSLTIVEQFTDFWLQLQLDSESSVALLQIGSWTLAFIIQATLLSVRWRLHLLSQGLAIAAFFCVHLAFGFTFIDPEEPLQILWQCFDLGLICLVCSLSVYLHERLMKAVFEARRQQETAYRQLQEAQAQSENLLLNILPSPIAKRLKSGEKTIADTFREVTVLFADLVGFTQLSTQISASELVDLLNQIFSQFDRLTEQEGLEKIKTIGDAYMVVAGLPFPRSDHAEAIANMALGMQVTLTQFQQQTGQPLAIRIGIHTGPVVAGVIGLKKFAYDLWGDTVNLASRMESHGIPGKIQVTAATYEQLKQKYEFQERGLVEVKGKGKIKTYLLEGCRPDL